MRGHGAVLTMSVVLACACGPAVVDDAEQGRICGQDGPVRILELDADEMPTGFGRSMARSGDRIYYAVGDAVTEADAPFGDSEFSAGMPKPGNPRVWSSGACGESPKLIGGGVETVFTHELWPGAVLGLAENGDVMALDPEGASAPRLFIPNLPFQTSTDRGFVGVVADESNGDVGRVIFQPYPASADAAVPAQIELSVSAMLDPGAVRGNGQEVFVIDTESRLQVIDLDTLEVEELRDDVTEIAFSSDGRVVVMKTTQIGAVDGARRVIALDRDTGVETELGDVDERWFPFTDGSFVVLDLAPSGQRLFTLPSLVAYDLPDGLRPSGEISDGVYLATQDDQRVTYELATGKTVLLGSSAYPFSLVDDGVVILELTPDFRAKDMFRKHAPLRHASFSGATSELVAERATLARAALPDGRFVTPVGVGTDYLGDLVVVEPGSLDEQRIDTEVVALDANLADAFPPGTAPVFDAGVIAYGVRDGDRSGIWLAKPE